MKLEFEIQDIDRQEIVDAMARQLLTRRDRDGDEVSTPLGDLLKRSVDVRIDALANEIVCQQFDESLKARISAEIDRVIEEGWYESDNWGGRKGERLDIKARIGKVLTEQRGDVYSRKPSLLQERIDEAIRRFMDKEFDQIVNEAKNKLRKSLDDKVITTVTESIKNAIGLK